MKTAFIISCLFLAVKVMAAPVKITGKAAEYARNLIELNIFHDYISEETIRLGDIRFNSEGVFELEVELAETRLCFEIGRAHV